MIPVWLIAIEVIVLLATIGALIFTIVEETE